MLSATGVPFEERDMVKQPITEAELRQMAAKVGLPALINRKGVKFKELGLATKQISDDEWFSLLAANSDLVKRPIVVIGDDVVPGLDKARIEALKPS